MIYVSKIGETIRYTMTPVWDATQNGATPKIAFSAACEPCRKLAAKKYPTIAKSEPVRCYHVAVQGTLRG